MHDILDKVAPGKTGLSLEDEIIKADIKTISQIPIVQLMLEVICKTTGMGFATIAKVTENRWVACGVRDEISFGLLPGGELKVETTLCNEVRQHHQTVVISHVSKDPEYCAHPTPIMYGLQSYIAAPIYKKDGSFFGTLCAIDPNPANINNPQTIGMFKMFADLISFHMNSLEELKIANNRILEEQDASKLREQFMAVLGHDLRNPLTSIMMGSEILLDLPLEEEAQTIAHTIKNSSLRMSLLINNILDFARENLGQGTFLQPANVDLCAILKQVVAELKTLYPDSVVECRFELNKHVYCDENRIGRLFSNLLSNALIHGTPDTPVTVFANSEAGFLLSVTNYGRRIPSEKIDRLFQPFYRGEEGSKANGLGLGLYIASEIAKAHNGTLHISSNDEQTSFIFSM